MATRNPAASGATKELIVANIKDQTNDKQVNRTRHISFHFIFSLLNSVSRTTPLL